MPTIIERSGRFMARVRVQGFRPVSKTFHRKPDAIAWGRTVEADMQAGRWKDDAEDVPTVRDALKTYRQQVVSKLKGADTYAYWLDELLSAPFAHKPVDTVTAADVSAWRDKLALSVKPGTVCRKLGLLSGFFTWAEKDCGWLSSNPVRSIRKPSANDARDRTVTPEELAYIQQAAASSRAKWLGDVLTILQTSAMRRGELWGLKVGAVDFEASTAHLSDTKNGSARDVPLCPTALAALRRLQDAAEHRRGDTLVPVASAHAVSLAFRRTLERYASGEVILKRAEEAVRIVST